MLDGPNGVQHLADVLCLCSLFYRTFHLVFLCCTKPMLP